METAGLHIVLQSGRGGRMAKEVALRDANQRFAKYVRAVEAGESFVITRRGKPVARLVPEGVQRLDDVRRSVEGLKALQQRIQRRSKARLTDREVRAAIDQGRL